MPKRAREEENDSENDLSDNDDARGVEARSSAEPAQPEASSSAAAAQAPIVDLAKMADKRRQKFVAYADKYSWIVNTPASREVFAIQGAVTCSACMVLISIKENSGNFDIHEARAG